MELIERAGFLATMQAKFEDISSDEGHCVLIAGEAGIGKTSLVRTFCAEKKNECKIYQGTCDAMFTPRVLGPLHDIAWQMRGDFWEDYETTPDRARLFSRFLNELSSQGGKTLIVFEDVHWADEATLDFIKFLARRITRVPCLFILTYRDDEIHSHHPLRNVLGQLHSDSFTRLHLVPFSRQAVEKMVIEKGYSGEDVYNISRGNPFYVNEILASYSPGVPDNIKDSILSVFNQQSEQTKRVWQILSVLPTGFETTYLEVMEPLYARAIENSLDSKILILKDRLLFFKHELYRRTIEASLSPFVRIALNKRILDLFCESFEQNGQVERIIHHAKNANEYALVTHYAPLAARHAASAGAHTEAARLYLTAIEYYQGKDQNKLLEFYELYAYECYLISKNKDAIIYTTKSLHLWKEKNNQEKIGDCMRFLSRLWWFEAKQEQAGSYAVQAIEVLDKQPSSKAKAMAYGNMARLKMSMDLTNESLLWGEKAIAIAQEVDDHETVSNALNIMGSALMLDGPTLQEGIGLLEQSLEIALKNSYHEHVARAYTSIVSIGVSKKEYEIAKKALDEGLLYCEEKDIDSQRLYMLAYQSRLNLETGKWNVAYTIADNLLKNEDLLPILKITALAVLATIKIRRGVPDALPLLLEAKALAFETMELQRIIPAFIGLLEYEWITCKSYVETDAFSGAINRLVSLGKFSKESRFYFWLRKTAKDYMVPGEKPGKDEENNLVGVAKEVKLWENWGCPYEQALALFEGNDADKKTALAIVQSLGADAVFEKMKQEMRASGIKSIPRGIRKATLSNPAHLTERELDVLGLIKEGLQNKEIGDKLFISAKTVDHHISAILLKLNVNSRGKAVQEAIHLQIIK
jgi:DNA-binding CsgD family transcriptional regulator/tetratricopeptide (TPR) repeat protein